MSAEHEVPGLATPLPAFVPTCIAAALLTLGLVGAWFSYAGTPLHHDPSFTLVATGRWLDGAKLYQDIMEINPPLIFYLTAPSVLVARIAGTPDATVFVLFMLGLIAIALGWSWSLVSRIPDLPPASPYVALAAFFVGLVVAPAF